MIVPHGSSPTRAIAVTRRALRVVVAAVSLGGLCALLALTALVAGAARTADPEALTTAERLVALQARLDSLQDTLSAIGRRDGQIRLLAGLPTEAETASVGQSPRAASTGGGSVLGRLARSAESDLERLIGRANLLARSYDEVHDTLTAHGERLARIPSIMPTAGWLSSQFSRSRNHPILHASRPHEGIDVAAPMGAPIIAPADGVVTSAGWERGYGRTVEIDHGNGIRTRYAHCSVLHVKRGERVNRGQLIAAVGNSGLSTGPHLHYEIHVNGRAVDPLSYVLPGRVVTD